MTAPVGGDVLRLPRDAWSDHPHFPAHALLLGSHDNFRRISRTLVERAQRGGDARAIGWMFRYWKSAMGSHEAYEEKKLYPFLQARWGISTEIAEEGHHKLHELERVVLQEVAASEDGASQKLFEALMIHDAVLIEHLELEEQMVIPALLALTPEEFGEYYHHDIHTLLSRLRAKRALAQE